MRHGAHDVLIQENAAVRFLFLSPAFPPFTGGGERYVQALALTLAEQQHTVTILTSTAQSERDFWQPQSQPAGPLVEKAGPLTIIRCPLRPLSGGRSRLLAWRKLMVLVSTLPGNQTRRLLALNRQIPPISYLEEVLSALPPHFDLAHAFNISWEYPMVAGLFFAKRQRLPYVLTPFAHFGETAGSKRRPSLRVARNSTMEHQRWLLESADAVLTLTDVEQEGFATWGINPRRVATVGGGLDPVEQVAYPDRVLTHYRLEKPFALFVGRHSPDKGTLHAAEATRAVRQSGSPLTLALVGRRTEEFDRYYEKLPATAREFIRPLGTLDDVEKHALLQEAAMLLLPSQTDSLGIVLLEAWFHGTPVIGARAGGIMSVVDDPHDGLLVPFGDVAGLARAIRHLLADEGRRERMGRRGQQKVQQQFTWERVGERVLDHYRSLIAAYR